MPWYSTKSEFYGVKLEKLDPVHYRLMMISIAASGF